MLTTAAGFSTYNGGSGIYTSDEVTTALMLAEQKVGEWLGTPVTPTTFTEEFPWVVDDGKVWLKKVRLISITEILGYYYIDLATCAWDSIAISCFMIYDAENSIVQVIDKSGVSCACNCNAWRICPMRLKITYIAGFTAAETDSSTYTGNLIRAAIYNCALGFLQTSIGLNATGNIFIPSFSIAGYQESRQLPERSGAEELINQHIQNAKSMLRGLTVKRPIYLRNRRKVLPV